jgi:very-short-patch-repair endonuclease
MAKAFFQPLHRTKRSALHLQVKQLLVDAFPGYTIGEEVPVEAGGRKLFVDLVVKEIQLVVECHGRQHFEFVKHFQKDVEGWKAAKGRDVAKEQAIRDAGYTFLVVRYDEANTLTPAKLLKKISKAMKESNCG